MIVVESQRPGQRRARVFFRELPRDLQTADTAVVARYWDDEDQEREPSLRRILAHTNISAVAYPTSGHRDVLQVFLKDHDRDDLVFACVLVIGALLRRRRRVPPEATAATIDAAPAARHPSHASQLHCRQLPRLRRRTRGFGDFGRCLAAPFDRM